MGIEVDQALPVFSLPDAVGNHALQTRAAILGAGMKGGIWAEFALAQITPEVRHFSRYRPRRRRWGSSRRVLLYQASTGSEAGMVDWFLTRPEPRTLCYHNITPPSFFRPYDERATATLRRARDELRRLAGVVRVAVADSTYNAMELRCLGVEEVRVIPPYLPPRLDAPPSADHLSWLRRRKRGIDMLFVGRVVPNKGHVHLLRAFAALKRTIDPNARLFIVGAWGPAPYMHHLFRIRDAMGIDGVAFTGMVAPGTLAAHYRAADLLVCLSEHEGFGIPLIEAMRFDVPVIAYDTAAVGETTGGAGVLLRSLEPRFVAEVIGRVAADGDLRRRLVERQRARVSELEAVPRDRLQVEAALRAMELA